MPKKNSNSLFSRYRNISNQCNICDKKISPRGNRKGLCRSCSLKDGYKNGRKSINKGKKLEYLHTREIREKISKALKGKKHSEEWKKNLSIKTKGRKGKPHSVETKLKLKNLKLGQKLSEETKRKIGLAQKGRIKTVNERENASKARKGEKSHFWKGGVTPINMIIRQSLKYKLWREAIFKRDNYVCVWCGNKGRNLNADHIKPFALYPELRFAIDNGRTLCIDCHRKTKTFGNNKFTRNACQETTHAEDDYPYPEEMIYSKQQNEEVLQTYNLK